MAINIQRYTIEQFEAFVQDRNNEDQIFEFIGGEIFEVPSNPYSSFIGAIILTALMNFVMPRKLGYVTGEMGGYQVHGERYAPDLAFISKEKQSRLVRNGYNPNPPDLAVEVVSPTDKERKLTVKVGNYLAAGTVVWVVYPETQEVEIYAPAQKVDVIGIDGKLEGRDHLEGFSLAVADIFPDDEFEPVE